VERFLEHGTKVSTMLAPFDPRANYYLSPTLILFLS